MIAVTIIVGFATWAWAGSAAINSEKSFGNAVAANISYLKESFVIVNANFSSSATQNVTLWLYNSGNTTVYIKQTWISNVTSVSSEAWTNTTSTLSSTYSAGCGYCLVLPVGQITPIRLQVNTPFKTGVIYQFKALGLYGNTYTYQQVR